TVPEARVPRPWGDPAVGLAVQDQRIDRAAHVVDRREGDDLDRARVDVDLDLAYLRAVGKARDGNHFVADAGERPLRVLRQVRALERGGRDIKQIDRAVGARDPIAAVREL